MYHLSALPPKRYTIPLIVSRQIRLAKVSPNLTDARMATFFRRAVANGPVGPAMAGPIIEPAIKKKTLTFFIF